MSHKNASPGLIILAERCHTFRERRRPAQAITVANGRIVRLGSRRDVLRTRACGTRVLDLGQATITPGLVDCHTHFFYWALMRSLVIDVSALASLDAVLTKLNKLAARRRVGDWVVGSGFDLNRCGGSLPTAADLDRAVRGRPALVRSRDGHNLWFNTAGMRALGIGPGSLDPPDGRHVRDEHGHPTGILQETTLDPNRDPLCQFARRTDAAARRVIDRALRAAYRLAWTHGIVGIHAVDDGASFYHLQRQRDEGQLGLRCVHAIPLAQLDDACRLGLRSGLGDDWFRVGGVKIFADGALGSQTAHMFDAYPGRGDDHGMAAITGDDLKQAVARAAAHGLAVWVHAIGDRAVHEVVDAIVAGRKAGTPTMPHRIEHAQCCRPADIRRMARAGIVASVQPSHILGDIPTADRHWPKARRKAYAFRSLLDAGVRLAVGSDVPIESPDVRRTLHGAVLRSDERGEPAGGWFPRQRITVEETLRAFTRGAAATVGLSPPAGTLAPGALADMTVWEDDPLRAAPADLLNIGILGCVVDGQVHLS